MTMRHRAPLRSLFSLTLLAAVLSGPAPAAHAGSGRETGASPLVVLDSADRLVGYPDSFGFIVLREVAGIWFTIPITEDGFALASIETSLLAGTQGTLFESTDCTGPAYISPAFGLSRYLTKLNGQLVYPSHPPVSRLIKSSVTPLLLGCNTLITPLNQLVAEPLAFDSSPLNAVTPPFRLAPVGAP